MKRQDEKHLDCVNELNGERARVTIEFVPANEPLSGEIALQAAQAAFWVPPSTPIIVSDPRTGDIYRVCRGVATPMKRVQVEFGVVPFDGPGRKAVISELVPVGTDTLEITPELVWSAVLAAFWGRTWKRGFWVMPPGDSLYEVYEGHDGKRVERIR